MVRKGVIMSITDYKTDCEIQHSALNAIYKSVGVANSIRFMQQLNKGYGNYSKDRHDWQDNYSVDQIINEMKNEK